MIVEAAIVCLVLGPSLRKRGTSRGRGSGVPWEGPDGLQATGTGTLEGEINWINNWSIQSTVNAPHSGKF